MLPRLSQSPGPPLLADIAPDTVTKPLHHYTDRAGFVGIISSRELWLSDVLHLNDAEEVAYGRSVIKDAVDRRARSEFIDLFRRCEEVGPSYQNSATFVACLSEQLDDLSQWRAYAGNGGFSITFRPSEVHSIARQVKGVVVRIRYDRDEQDDLADRMLDWFEATVANSETRAADWLEPGYLQSMARLYSQNANYFAAWMKHPAFISEKEWRIIAIEDDPFSNRICFRAGPSMVVPHISCALAGDVTLEWQFPVMVGPCHQPDLETRAAWRLLKQKGFGGGRPGAELVDRSKAPYRIR